MCVLGDLLSIDILVSKQWIRGYLDQTPRTSGTLLRVYETHCEKTGLRGF